MIFSGLFFNDSLWCFKSTGLCDSLYSKTQIRNVVLANAINGYHCSRRCTKVLDGFAKEVEDIVRTFARKENEAQKPEDPFHLSPKSIISTQEQSNASKKQSFNFKKLRQVRKESCNDVVAAQKADIVSAFDIYEESMLVKVSDELRRSSLVEKIATDPKVVGSLLDEVLNDLNYDESETESLIKTALFMRV